MFLNYRGNRTKICISHVTFFQRKMLFSTCEVQAVFLGVPNPHRIHVHCMFFSMLNEHVTSKNVWFLHVKFMHLSAKAVFVLSLNDHTFSVVQKHPPLLFVHASHIFTAQGLQGSWCPAVFGWQAGFGTLNRLPNHHSPQQHCYIVLFSCQRNIRKCSSTKPPHE